MWHSANKKTLAFLIAFLLVIGLGLLGFTYRAERSVNNPLPSFEPYTATLSGTYVCLPHTDTSGPQTLECALGLQTDEGVYYALDFNQLSEGPPTIPTGSRITVSGTVTPTQNLSTNHWRIYPIDGIFSVVTYDSSSQSD